MRINQTANKHFLNIYYLERGFMSTSLLKPNSRLGDDESLLKIYVDKGTVGAYVPTVAGRSEYELLLQNNLYIRLCNKPYFDEKINAYIYECKISANGIEESRKMIFFTEENFEKIRQIPEFGFLKFFF